MSDRRVALVVGSTGLAGASVVRRLAREGFEVVGMSRSHSGLPNHLRIDMSGEDDLGPVEKLAPTHVFVTAWKRHPTEAENIAVNRAMVRKVVQAAGQSGAIEHIALLTGLKHYIGPPELQGKIALSDTPFVEDSPRLPVPLFYYAQEDELFRGAERFGFRWTVHRTHTIIGCTAGSAMNLAGTLAAQAAIAKFRNDPFVFPGSRVRWDGLADLTDADLLADHITWAAMNPEVANEAYNVVNGDVFRWKTMWRLIADMLDVQAADYPARVTPLTQQMSGAETTWRELAHQQGLAEHEVDRVAAWWHVDADLGRSIEMLADMSKSRRAGYTGYMTTELSFRRTFQEYMIRKLIPSTSLMDGETSGDRNND